HKNFNQNTLSLLAFCVSVFSLMISTVVSAYNISVSMKAENLNEQGGLTIITIVFLFLIIIVMIEIAFKYYSLNYTREKWMRYIEYALQDIEKEY
uniref:hypothetical protein n=1 Tax=Lachnospira eligens TaxID=39485 RepID=UPI004026A323